MNSNASTQLSRVLDGLDYQIKRLESSPNRMLVSIEYHHTLRLFHFFNLYFKKFCDEFDHNSACQLLQYKKIERTYSDLRNRHVSLIREQLDYLEREITIEAQSVKIELPLNFLQDDGTGVIEYYQEYFKYAIATKERPLHKIFFDNETQSDFIDEENIPQDFYVFCSYLINDSHYKGLYGMYSSLNRLYLLFDIFCSYVDKLLSSYKPSLEDIIRSLEKESRQYANEIGTSVERDLRKIAQKMKTSRNTSLTPDIWGKVMEEEDQLFDLAINDLLDEKEEIRLENISVSKEQLIDNYSLLQKIKSTCLDEELFDIRLSVETHNLLSSLNADNLELFYELILRRNIIQREMFPDKLKAQYEEWLNQQEELESEEGDGTGLSAARQSKLDELIGILKKGNWKQPATADNIEILLNAVFGKDVSLYDEDDANQCEKIWALIEGGSGDRMLIIPANLAGFFSEENLLIGSPKDISDDLFGKNNNQSNNINKGKSNYCSNAFGGVIPFLKKYIDKIIRQG